jgi:hypothetical protein
VWQDEEVDFSSDAFGASAFFADAGAIAPNRAASEPTKITFTRRMRVSPSSGVDVREKPKKECGDFGPRDDR